ncbi:MAG: hypothetical protein IJF18_01340 [Oscillospiraceae bacterium]|nr:hypothetical protein [Oscillospiraceae bacterium]
MVIHTIINEYDLLYAQTLQEKELPFKADRPAVCVDLAALTAYTALPDLRKGTNLNDNT